MATRGGIVLSCLNALYRCNVASGVYPGALSQLRHYAARKSTRERARKKKVKQVEVKLTLAEKIRRSKKIKIIQPDILLYNDENWKTATDDVWVQQFYSWRIFSFSEAVQAHREYLHPTMLNAPNSMLKIFVELNMMGVKKTKPLEAFSRLCPMNHPFDHGEERNILVFCKTEEDTKTALDSGASIAGSSELIKMILNGDLSVHNYDTVIAHPNIMPEVLTLRGLLKKKLPNLKSGTMGADLKKIIHTQKYGIKYTAKPYEHFPMHGTVEIPIGNLPMETDHLEENFRSALDSIMKNKPKRPGVFIQRIRLKCPPSPEALKLNHRLYVQQEEEPESAKDKFKEAVHQEEEEDDDEDEEEAAVAQPI